MDTNVHHQKFICSQKWSCFLQPCQCSAHSKIKGDCSLIAHSCQLVLTWLTSPSYNSAPLGLQPPPITLPHLAYKPSTPHYRNKFLSVCGAYREKHQWVASESRPKVKASDYNSRSIMDNLLYMCANRVKHSQEEVDVSNQKIVVPRRQLFDSRCQDRVTHLTCLRRNGTSDGLVQKYVYVFEELTM